jgi:hypothetical protein
MALVPPNTELKMHSSYVQSRGQASPSEPWACPRQLPLGKANKVLEFCLGFSLRAWEGGIGPKN